MAAAAIWMFLDLVRNRGDLPIQGSTAEQLERRWRKVRKKGKISARSNDAVLTESAQRQWLHVAGPLDRSGSAVDAARRR
jgi:hypothetical protein